EVEVADHAGLIAILLQVDGLDARFQRVVELRKLRVRREQPEIRARNLGRDRGANRLAGILGCKQIVLRSTGCDTVLAPEIELVGRGEVADEVVADRRCSEW